MLWKYLGGTTVSRAGDEMTGPALLLLGFAVTGRPGTGSALLASVTIAGAAGGPVFGALLDRSRRPDRILAGTLAGYALGIVAVQAAVGQLPMPTVITSWHAGHCNKPPCPVTGISARYDASDLGGPS